MKLVFAEQAWEDYVYRQQQDKRMVYKPDRDALLIAQLQHHY